MNGDWKFAIISIVVLVFFIATLMEFYKKTIRKDKAGVWEIRAVSAVLTAFASLLVYAEFNWKALVPDITGWGYLVIYILIWLLQKDACMNVIKAIIKKKAEK